MNSGSLLQKKIYVEDLIDQLMVHPLYESLCNEQALRLFMRSHVFCVWDFQCLIKALQRSLTCVKVPWFPTRDPEARRLINGIVLDEESDQGPHGEALSHYEMYLQAMFESQADATPIESFISNLRSGLPLQRCLLQTDLPKGVSQFLSTTLQIAQSGEVHRVAAAFTYGREEIIPEMFRQLVKKLVVAKPKCWEQFHYYLNRHIEKDSQEHGPMAHALLNRICGKEPRLWEEAEKAARISLQARIQLWDHILFDLKK